MNQMNQEMVARDGIEPPTMPPFSGLWWPGTESNRRRQPFQGCGLFFQGFALALGSRPFGPPPRSPRAQQILMNQRLMVARDGIEPPTPAFSGLRSTN